MSQAITPLPVEDPPVPVGMFWTGTWQSAAALLDWVLNNTTGWGQWTSPKLYTDEADEADKPDPQARITIRHGSSRFTMLPSNAIYLDRDGRLRLWIHDCPESGPR